MNLLIWLALTLTIITLFLTLFFNSAYHTFHEDLKGKFKIVILVFGFISIVLFIGGIIYGLL